jgi:DNA polymerase I-like protein with 3'-5' exonuclease and polymerase domains
LDVPPWKHVSGEETYNPQDVANTKGIFHVIDKEIKFRKMEDFRKFENAQIPIAIMFGLQGVKVDEVEKEKLKVFYTKKEKELKIALDKETEKYGKFNYNSPSQLKDLLYNKMRLPAQYKRRKSVKDVRKETTDAEALRKLSQKSNSPIPRLLIDLKKTRKAISSYLSFEVSPQGTIHTTYNIGSAIEKFKLKLGQEDNKSLGRWSSSTNIILPYGPGNFQSIPSYARSMIVPFEENYEIGVGDYIQAEAVMVAYLSNNEVLINAIEKGYQLRRKEESLYENKNNPDTSFIQEEFNTKLEEIKLELKRVDIHRIKASEIFDIPVLEITDEQRQLGKLLRHARNYDAGPAVVQASAATAGIFLELSYCKRLLEIDDKKSPYLNRWHKTIIEEMGISGKTLTNALGRKRRFLGAWGPDMHKRGYAFKPQSTIGDLLNKSIIHFYANYGELYRLLLQLHDGLYISYLKSERLKALRNLRKSMIRPILINKREVTIDVDFKAGPNWKDMKEVIVY